MLYLNWQIFLIEALGAIQMLWEAKLDERLATVQMKLESKMDEHLTVVSQQNTNFVDNLIFKMDNNLRHLVVLAETNTKFVDNIVEIINKTKQTAKKNKEKVNEKAKADMVGLWSQIQKIKVQI